MARLVASDELAESGWLKKVTVRLHLLICVGCREYTEQIRRIGDAVRAAAGCGNGASIEASERDILERIFSPSADEGQDSVAPPRRRMVQRPPRLVNRFREWRHRRGLAFSAPTRSDRPQEGS